jgi:hypothetical protein
MGCSRTYVGVNGYRYYQREQLLRQQQILLLRELSWLYRPLPGSSCWIRTSHLTGGYA